MQTLQPFPLCPRYTLFHKICHLIITFSAFRHPCKGHQDHLIHGAGKPPRDGGAETVPGWLEKLAGCFTHQLEPKAAKYRNIRGKIELHLKCLQLLLTKKGTKLRWYLCWNSSFQQTADCCGDSAWTLPPKKKTESELLLLRNDIIQGTPIFKMISPSNFQQLPTNMHPFVQTPKLTQKSPLSQFRPAPSRPLRKCVDHQSPTRQKCQHLGVFLLFKLCLTHVVIENHVEFRENIPQRRRSLQGKSSNWKNELQLKLNW